MVVLRNHGFGGISTSWGSTVFLSGQNLTIRNLKGGPVPEQTVQSGLSDNAASGLAYITFIPAIVFLVTAPYNQNPTIRFHSWQSIFLNVACIVVDIGLSVVAHLPFFGFMTLAIWPLVGLAFFVVWILCLIKAFNGQRFKLPIIGGLAEKQAGGVAV
jgi:uncharacterized membrane protein